MGRGGCRGAGAGFATNEVVGIKPILVAAPSSGCGKTTLTLGLLAALRRRGLVVAPFKVGPDFIDPGHHRAACGRVSRNLDSWMCSEAQVAQIFGRGCAGAQIALIEGVMGLFDGARGDTDSGSSAEIARMLGASVVLVVDARAQARSAAALVQGFVRFDPRLEFAGVIFNRVGSEGHAQILRQTLDSVPGMPPLLGCLPRQEELGLPERHLGLVTAEDLGGDENRFESLADWVERHLDLDALIAAHATSAPAPFIEDSTPQAGEKQVRIAVARDAAFCFYYPENLEWLQRAGAELVFFSPLAGEGLPEGIDGLYLGGGYPELHAEALFANAAFFTEIRKQAAQGLPVYAECGGFMALAQGIDGTPMAGVFPVQARMFPKRRALGYREVTLVADGLLGPAGTVVRGHEFHYSDMDMPAGVERIYSLTRRAAEPAGQEGYRIGNVLGSYVHLHFGSNPRVAENFVRFCRQKKSD